MALSSLNLKFGMDIAEITSGVNKMQKEMGTIKNSIMDTQRAIVGGIAGFGLAAAFGKIVSGARDAQAAMAQVEAGVRSTGGAAGVTAKQIDEMANALKRKTGVDDDAIKSAQALLLTFTRINKDIFPETTALVVDMSKRMGNDLNGAAIQLGKALNDPIKGITGLTKAGVVFTDTQKEMIKKLVESGQVLKAQEIILKEVRTEFGGSAAAARDTLGGALDALKQNVDDLIDSFNGTNGLRQAVEFANQVLEETIDTVTEAQKPTSALGQQVTAFSKNLVDSYTTMKAWVGFLGDGIKLTWQGFAQFGANVAAWAGGIANVMSSLSLGVTKWFESMNPVNMGLNWGKQLGGAFQDLNKRIKDNFGSGVLPNYFKDVDAAIDRTAKKLKGLSAAAEGYRGPRANTDYGPTSEQNAAAKAAEKKLEAEKKRIEDIIAAQKNKNEGLRAELKDQQGLANLLDQQRQIMQQSNVPLAQRKSAVEELNKLYKEQVELTKQLAVKKEGEQLKELVKEMQAARDQMVARNDAAKHMIPILEAEEKIRQIQKESLGQHLDLVKQIREQAELTSEEIKKQEHKEALKNLKAISDEQEKQMQMLRNKLAGQEELNELIDIERKIRENIYLTADEKDQALAKAKANIDSIKKLNDALDDQQKVLDKIKNTGLSYKRQIEELSKALAAGQINSKQYADAINQINNAQAKAKGLMSDFGKAFTSAFSGVITGSKSAKDAMLDFGKAVADLAAKQLLLKPLEAMFSSLGSKLFGNGKSGTSGTTGSASGASGGAASGGGILPLLGSALGNPLGLGGLSKGGLGGLAGLWTNSAVGLGNLASSAIGAPNLLNSILGNIANGGSIWSTYGIAQSQGQGKLFSGALTGAVGIGSILGHLSGILGFATGGNATGGSPFLAGENGTELIVPMEDMHIFSALQTEQIAANLALFQMLSSMGFGGDGGGQRQVNQRSVAQQAYDGALRQYYDLGQTGMQNNGAYQQNNLDRQAWVSKWIDGGTKTYDEEIRRVMTQAAQAEASNQLRNASSLEHWGTIQASQIAAGNFGPMGSPMTARTATLPDGDQWTAILNRYRQMGVSVSDGLMDFAEFRDQWTRVQMGNNPNQPLSDAQGMSMSMGFGMSNVTSFGDGTGGLDSFAYGGGGVSDTKGWGNYFESGGGYDLDFGGAQGWYKKLQAQDAANRNRISSAAGLSGKIGGDYTELFPGGFADVRMSGGANGKIKNYHWTDWDYYTGGRPQIDMPAIVGERGPELFVPDVAGTIVPNNKFSMGQAPTVTIKNSGSPIQVQSQSYNPQTNELELITAAVAQNIAYNGVAGQAVRQVNRRPARG